MNNMQARFKRAYQVLDKEYGTMNDEHKQQMVHENAICLRWLRNEAKLWEDYEEDPWYVNGCDNNPNHPDNLSYLVYEWWKTVKKV